uniref:RNA-binding protein 15-like n=1 Tax=Myxine glutinosa TaxID=7769 RepID=UPI00358FFBBE
MKRHQERASPPKGKRPRNMVEERDSRSGPGHRGQPASGRRTSPDRGDKLARRDEREFEARSGSVGGAGGFGGRTKRGGDPAAREYKTLLVRNVGSQLSDEQVEDGLFREFKKFGDVSVKIAQDGGDRARVAYVSFRRADEAREARRAKPRPTLYQRQLRVDAVYPRRRSPSLPEYDTYGAQVGYPPYAPPPTPPPPPSLPPPPRAHSPVSRPGRDSRGRRGSPVRNEGAMRDRDLGYWDYGSFDRLRGTYGGGRRDEEEFHILPEDDQKATRTLFIGNLDLEVSEVELKRMFDRFGFVEEVDIKHNSSVPGNSYGFVKFRNLDMAHRAKVAMSGKLIGRSAVNIGYGKANRTTRLWVGGLGPWLPVAALAREFDRFGTIRSIDYRKGETFAYIQYESIDAAIAAWAQMRGFYIPGMDRRLRVDFADLDQGYMDQAPRPFQPQIDGLPDGYGGPYDMRTRDRTSPLKSVQSVLHYRDRNWSNQDGNWPNQGKGGTGGARVPVSFDTYAHVDRGRHRDSWPPGDRARDFVAGPPAWEDRRRRRSPPPPSLPPPLSDGYNRCERSPFDDRSSRRHYGSADRGRDGGPPGDLERVVPSELRSDGLRVGLLTPNDHRQREANGCDRTRPQSIERHRRPYGGEADNRGGKGEVTVKNESGRALPQVLSEFARSLSPAWQGVLVLKNSSFPTRMFLVAGDLSLAQGLLQDGTTGGPASQLKITQRLRLDPPKLEEVTRRMKLAGADGHCVLLALHARQGAGDEPPKSGDPRPLRNLVSYLKQKQAAGVISLPIGSGGGGAGKERDGTGVLHTFPPCEFSQQFLQEPARTLARTDDDHLIVIIVRGNA